MPGALDRIEYSKLMNTVAESNIPDHKKQAFVDDLWSETQDKYPIVDDKGNINNKNAEKWRDVLKQKLSGGEDAGTEKATSENIEDTKTKGGKTYIKVNGKWFEK